jgi:hypothetical protein
MNYDELDKKIIGIRKRGLNKILEDTLIADIRGEFYETGIVEKMDNISQRFKRNVKFLSRIHGSTCAASKIRENMGITTDKYFNDVVFFESRLQGLKTPLIVAEFYGLPVELLLFSDLEANEQRIKTEYPALFKQSRY